VGGCDISSRKISMALIPKLLLILAATPHATFGETIGNWEYRNPGLFQYEHQRLRSIDPVWTPQKPDRVSPSYRQEFLNTRYQAMPQGRYFQRDLLHKGFKFRDISEENSQGDRFSQYQPQFGGGSAQYPWNSGVGSKGPAPRFRPLDNVGLKKRESKSGRGDSSVWVSSIPYDRPDDSNALRTYTPIGPVFRPIP